jgi:Response regulator containing a CheY-like receiver domain and an HTH DNA-binding domain
LEETIKIVVVDDHEFFRKGLVLVLAKMKFVEVVGEATNGQELLDMLDAQPVDMVLMDINMPNMNGVEATQKALAKYPGLKIIALSSHEDEDSLETMIEAGVKGFLIKNIDKEVLSRALQAVAQDKPFFSEEFMPYFAKKYLNVKTQPTPQDNQLTKRELEVLQLIASGCTNQEIADKLFISLRTVTNHRASLYQKTNVNNTAALLALAIKNKWVTL